MAGEKYEKGMAVRKSVLGRKEELELHIRATRNTGVGADELKEILMHVAVYAGVPAANTAFAVAKSVCAENSQ